MSNKNEQTALPPGHLLNWYKLKDLLGRGGFGITYLAQDPNLDLKVAIKEYFPVQCSERKEASVFAREGYGEQFHWGLTRFIEEARLLARFNHPNVVRVLSCFEANGTAYMVMEYEEGMTLSALLEKEKFLSEERLLNLLYPILSGLEVLHRAGTIHRDLKPGNILLRKDGVPVLIDFGSARETSPTDPHMTVLISTGYTPFEQYNASGGGQGPWTDIYALAATIYRAMTGHKPVDAHWRAEAMLNGRHDPLTDLTCSIKGPYSKPFLEAITRGLAFKAEDRPRSVREWMDMLPRPGPESRMPQGVTGEVTVVKTADVATVAEFPVDFCSPVSAPAGEGGDLPGQSQEVHPISDIEARKSPVRHVRAVEGKLETITDREQIRSIISRSRREGRVLEVHVKDRTRLFFSHLLGDSKIRDKNDPRLPEEGQTIFIEPLVPPIGNVYLRTQGQASLRIVENTHAFETVLRYVQAGTHGGEPALELTMPIFFDQLPARSSYRAPLARFMNLNMMVRLQDGRVIPGKVINISAGGLAFCSDMPENPIPLNAPVQMTLDTQKKGEQLIVDGYVRNISRECVDHICGKGHMRCGIQFDLPTQRMAMQVENLVAYAQRFIISVSVPVVNSKP